MEQRKQKKRHRIFLVSESTKEDMRMANVLQQYFPMIRTRKEILGEISENKRLRCIWQEWNEEQQKEFMMFCTGAKGIKILYDSFFKEYIQLSGH